MKHTNLYQTFRFPVTARDAAIQYGLTQVSQYMRLSVSCESLSEHEGRWTFFCFDCGTKGDVTDFTARLFQLPQKQATEKLLDDFGIFAGNEPGAPNGMKQITMNPEQKKENGCFISQTFS